MTVTEKIDNLLKETSGFGSYRMKSGEIAASASALVMKVAKDMRLGEFFAVGGGSSSSVYHFFETDSHDGKWLRDNKVKVPSGKLFVRYMTEKSATAKLAPYCLLDTKRNMMYHMIDDHDEAVGFEQRGVKLKYLKM